MIKGTLLQQISLAVVQFKHQSQEKTANIFRTKQRSEISVSVRCHHVVHTWVLFITLMYLYLLNSRLSGSTISWQYSFLSKLIKHLHESHALFWKLQRVCTVYILC